MLQLEHIHKNYGKKEILKDISITVEEGECLGIVGPNGSGKSTLLGIIVGALKADGGVVKYEGRIGYVPQDNALMEELTVKDNLEYWCSAHGKALSHILSSEFFKSVLGLGAILKKKVKHLSGGMKKRVNIGIALINDPHYIILDEPCSALDIIYKNEVIDYLKQLKRQGKTIIYTSHSSDEIEKLCDHVCILKEGTIVKSASLVELQEEYSQYGSFDEMVYGLLK